MADDDRDRIRAAMTALRDDQVELEKAVAQALLNGASIRAVAEGTGLSQNTIQKYGRAHGWPTEDNRQRFNESRWDRQDRSKQGEQRG
jgi:transposase